MAKLLLDTCTFLWFISGDKKLPEAVKKLIVHPQSVVWLSTLSIWEVTLKQQTGRLHLPETPQIYLPTERKRHGLESLLLDEASVGHLIKLPVLHRDPFDRMLICQAMEHGLTIVTPDRAITQYPIKTLWEDVATS